MTIMSKDELIRALASTRTDLNKAFLVLEGMMANETARLLVQRSDISVRNAAGCLVEATMYLNNAINSMNEKL